MKKILPFLLLGFFACGNPAAKDTDSNTPVSHTADSLGKASLQCLGEKWSGADAGKLWKGIQALDDMLFADGRLGKRTGDDYVRLSQEMTPKIISRNSPGFEGMRLIMGTGQTGAPDVSVLANCFNIVADAENDLPKDHPYARFVRAFKAMAMAGAPDLVAFNKACFGKLSAGEMRDPFILTSFYLFNAPNLVHFEVTPDPPILFTPPAPGP